MVLLKVFDNCNLSLCLSVHRRLEEKHKAVGSAAATPNTSVLARSSSSMNGRVEVMMSHLPEGAQAGGGGGGGGGGTPKTSFKMPSMKPSMHDLVQVSLSPVESCQT